MPRRSRAGAGDVGVAGRQAEPVERGDRRALVLETAASLFAEHGYSGTSLNDISTGAGIAKPTLYHYFSSKAEILDEILSLYVETLIARAEAAERAVLPAPERLLGVMADIVGTIETHRGHVRSIFEHLAHLPPERRRALAHRQDHYSQLVEDIMREGQREGSMSFDDIPLTRLGIFGMCSWTYQWYRPGGGRDPAEIARMLWDLCMVGLRPDDE
jgi:AcrR family transcriptional regulator